MQVAPARRATCSSRSKVAYFTASVDTPEQNARNSPSRSSLDYPILSDPDKSVAKAYGVLNPERGFANRWTFYIDKDGIIRGDRQEGQHRARPRRRREGQEARPRLRVIRSVRDLTPVTADDTYVLRPTGVIGERLRRIDAEHAVERGQQMLRCDGLASGALAAAVGATDDPTGARPPPAMRANPVSQ